jgi:hypothetical protein
VRVEGRSGIAGAEDVVEGDDKAEDCGADAEKPVEDAIEDDNAVKWSWVSICKSDVNITG